MRCDECKWYRKMASNGGECRRHAPRPADREENDTSQWPYVLPTDWCGEHVLIEDDERNEP